MSARTRQAPSPETASVRISLLGQVSISGPSRQLGEERLAGHQGRLLFAYLVAERGRPVSHEDLAEVLWGESPPATWEKALTVLVSKLRAAFGESGLDGATALNGARGYYRLVLPDGAWVDIAAAEQAAAEAASARVEDRCAESVDRARAALEIARQPFLPGEDGLWVEGVRRELADIVGEALACAIDSHLALGNSSDATRLAEEAIALQPFSESGYRRLMEAHAAAGNRAEALRVYDGCRRLLSDELGAYPSPETEAIFHELLHSPAPPDGQPASEPARAHTPVADAPVRAMDAPADGADVRPVERKRLSPRTLAIITGALVVTVAIVVVFSSGENSPHPIGASTLASLDARSGKQAAQSAAERPYSALAAGDGALWAVDAENSAAVRLGPKEGTVRDTVAVGEQPVAVAVGLGSVWVANAGDGTVSRISAQRSAVVQTIAVGNGPSALALGAKSVWVADRLDSAITRIDPLRGRVSARIPISAAPAGLAYAAGSIWVTGDAPATVFRIDPATNRVVESINVGRGADQIAGAGRSVWVANGGDGTVSRIDPSSDAVTTTVTLGGGPLGGGPVALAASGDSVWAARARPAALARIDAETSRVMQTRPLGAPATALAVHGQRMWVATGSIGRRGGTVIVSAAGPPEARPSVDPAHVYDAAKWTVMANVYDGLVGYKRVGGTGGASLVPDLARSIPAPTDSGRTYTFELRPGIRFSNGKPLRASEVAHTFERVLAIGPPGAAYFDALRRRGGIVADDERRTVVFHLNRRDPEFVTKLALPFAWVVPASAPMSDLGTHPLPGTGPYRIVSFVPAKRLTLDRNPHFRAWSGDAQPPGKPDRIAMKFTPNIAAALSPSQIDRSDVAVGTPRPADAAALLARYAARIQTFPTASSMMAFMNTRAAPFDDVRVRRAVNYAIDRARLARLVGGPLVAQPACQTLPPGLRGYRPYCPYTLSPGAAGVWTAADLAKARRLIRQSHRKGATVTVWGFHAVDDATREIASTLNRIGLRARPKLVSIDEMFTRASDSRGGVQISVGGWGADYPTPLGFLFNIFDCRAFVPASDYNSNFSEFCDRRVQSAMGRALAAEQSDAGASAPLWARVDRMITDAAPAATFATQRTLAIVSKRVQNYQFHPQWGPLLSQISLR